jgi:transketolase
VFAAHERNDTKKPTLIVANSVKGKGVSFMENKANWHHGGIDDDLYVKALAEVENK